MNVKALLFLLWLNVHHGFSQSCTYMGLYGDFPDNLSHDYADYFVCQSITKLAILHDINIDKGLYAVYYNDDVKVIINGSNIPSISLNLFNPNVRKKIDILLINNSNVNEIEAGAFQGYENIKNISFTFNNISSLDNNPFINLDKLFYVNLSHNNINSVKSQHFIHTPIESLDLSNNKLNEFNLPYSHTLKILNLANNKIRTLDSITFYQSYQLTQLFLRGNEIAVIPNGYFEKQNELLHLDISFNMLKSLNPQMLRGLDALTVLKLAYNLISSIDSNSFQFTPKLTHLYLNFNLIAEFPNFEQPNSLQSIDLSHNLILALQAASLRGLKSLEQLDLSYNRIKRVPAGISENAPMLTKLDVRNVFQACIESSKNNFTFIISNYDYMVSYYCKMNFYKRAEGTNETVEGTNEAVEGTNVPEITVFAVLGVAALVIVIFCVKKYLKLMSTKLRSDKSIEMNL